MSFDMMTVNAVLVLNKPGGPEGAPLTIPGLIGGDSNGQQVPLWLVFCLLWGIAPILSTRRSIMH